LSGGATVFFCFGRALTPDEQRRSDKLGRAIPLLDEALAILEVKDQPEPE
jgi:hypothetical protein